MSTAVVHELPGRLSLVVDGSAAKVADGALESALWTLPGVLSVRFRRRARRLVLEHDGHPETVDAVFSTLARLGKDRAPAEPVRAPATAAARPSRVLMSSTALFAVIQLLPGGLRVPAVLWGAYPHLRKGLRSLLSGRLDACTMDATAIATALLSGQYWTAGLVSFLLTVGNELERITERTTDARLTDLLRKEVAQAWVIENGNECQRRSQDLRPGDTLVLRPTYIVPADAVVIQGDALVNQSVVTGEAWPQPVAPGAAIHEGAVVVEGMIHARVSQSGEQTRLAQMLRIIEAAKSHDAEFSSYAQALADRTAPYILGGAVLIFALTGDSARAASALMVDYSCALRLTIPMIFRAGIMEAGSREVLIKGGRWVEKLSKVDAVAFDKTGTLTEGRPRVSEFLAVNGYSRAYLLRNVACVEEHFAHPIAAAVVAEARNAGLDHAIETHGALDYRLSAGVTSSVEGKKFIVGGERILEANGIDVTAHGAEIRRLRERGYSIVFIAVEHDLAGIIALDDPLHGEARRAISRLRELGIEEIVMLTGDSRASAERIAGALDLDECHPELFPEEKVAIIEALRSRGRVVAMLGDGLNDGPALSRADVGISVASGADLSREVAEVVLLAPTLELLPWTIELSQGAVRRAHRFFRWIVAVNSSLLALSTLGMIGPARAALLHNATTVFLSLRAARRVHAGRRASPAGSESRRERHRRDRQRPPFGALL